MNTNGTAVTSTGIAVALAVVVALGFLLIGPSFVMTPEPQQEAVALNAAGSAQLPNQQLMISDTVVGTGEEAVPGKRVTVNYVGKFENGQVFDASERHGEPFSFRLGEQSVIQGWEQGLIGMKVGGKRTLVVPPELGYGDVDRGVIPPNSTLIFDIELVSVD